MPITKTRGLKTNNRASKIRQGHPSMTPLKVVKQSATNHKKYS